MRVTPNSPKCAAAWGVQGQNLRSILIEELLYASSRIFDPQICYRIIRQYQQVYDHSTNSRLKAYSIETKTNSVARSLKLSNVDLG